MKVALTDIRLEDEEVNGEGEGWDVDQVVKLDDRNVDLCLVGCFLTGTTVNFQSMKIVLANLWHPLGGATITEIGDKRFLFQFYCEANLSRIVKGAPWTFNSYLLVFEQLQSGVDPLEVPLFRTVF